MFAGFPGAPRQTDEELLLFAATFLWALKIFSVLRGQDKR